MKNKFRQYRGVLTLCLLAGFSIAIFLIPSDMLIGYLGSENGYYFMYLIAFVGSISTFASIPYPLFLIALAAGGYNPILIGLASALGVITADSLTFFAIRNGRAVLSDRIQQSINSFSKRIQRHPKLLTPGLLLYGIFSPLSNDFAVISFSLMRYRYMQVIPPLACGNIMYNIGLAYLGVYAYEWVSGVLL